MSLQIAHTHTPTQTIPKPSCQAALWAMSAFLVCHCELSSFLCGAHPHLKAAMLIVAVFPPLTHSRKEMRCLLESTLFYTLLAPTWSKQVLSFSYDKEINCFSVRDSGQNKAWNCSLPIDCQDNLRYGSPTPTPSLARETQHPYSEAGSAHASAFS